MIESLTIANLRGIREGKLDGFFPLTLLMGPNNSGKSTVLEGLFLLSAPYPGTLMQILTRRGYLGRLGVMSAMPKGDVSLRAISSGQPGEVTLRLTPPSNGASTTHATLLLELRASRGTAPISIFTLRVGDDDSLGVAATTQEFDPNQIDKCVFLEAHPSYNHEEALAAVDRAGETARQRMLHSLRVVDPGLRDIRPIRVRDTWVPHAIYDTGAIPLVLAGDGMKRLVGVAAQLAGLVRGLALIEEPECFQHPRSLAEMVKVIWAGIEAGNQVVLSTHSMELFDFLFEEAKRRKQLDKIGLFRLALKNGELKSRAVTGEAAYALRSDVAEDLRL
jgi:energy-coupling factor transporter ATP-binding protein EcfA2